MKTIIKIKPPSVPSFLTYDGFPNAKIPISQFSEKELKKIGKDWTNRLIEASKG